MLRFGSKLEGNYYAGGVACGIVPGEELCARYRLEETDVGNDLQPELLKRSWQRRSIMINRSIVLLVRRKTRRRVK